ncbi:MucBP domain-containing protein [Enterococcus mundtii]|uniref:MucBP domain-containing protein n=2 Tax=Enterococcus mundtii TaxID=53346 RepID=UPI000824471E|nr:MucBP domain-containing protein [Enterococcus mundtii]
MNKIKLMSIFSVILLLLHFPVSVYATFNDYMLDEIHQGKSLSAWLYDEGENAISQQISATPQVDGSLGVDVGDSVSFSINIPTYALVTDRGGWIPALTGGKSGNTPVPNYFYTQMRYGKSPNLLGNFSIGEVTATNLPSGVTISRVVGPTTGNHTRVDVTVTRSQVSATNGHTNSINLNLSSLYLDTWAIDPTTADFFGNNPINVGGITLTNLNLGTLSLRTKNSIKVRYIDEEGNELRAPLVEQMEVGQNYAYTPPVIPGYTFSRLSSGSASASGQMAAGPERLVEFVYTKNPTVGGAITVNHEFIGASSMNSSERFTNVGNVGDRFELTPRAEAGWQVKGELPEVIVTEQAQTVTIQYERKPGGAITVNHEFIGDSSMNTNEVITDVGNVGDRFELMPRTEAGWQVKGELPEVIVTEQAQTVTIQYERKVGGQVVVNHIFEEAPEKNRMDILLGRWGEAFKAEPMQIAGWEVKETIGQPTGVFTDEEQEINFVYVRNEEQPIPEEDKPNDNKDKQPETKPVDQTTDKKTSTKKNDGGAIRRKEEKRSLPRLNSQAGISLTVVGTSIVAFVFWKQLKKRTKCKNK